jgi:hypothetical protein
MGWISRSRCTGRTASGWSGSTTPIRWRVQEQGGPQDHRHRLRTIRAYEYQDAATLLADFWETVDAVLRERGVIP